MENNNGREIAMTILTQLLQSENHGRLKAMVGATNVIYDKNGTLTFKFKGSKVASWVKIIHNSLDLYDVVFSKQYKQQLNPVKYVSDVYNDQLKGIFESTTGLYLSL